ncbi:site-specific integrase [Dactylosporangium aurantiacum]|uniref:Site-specific integrase n=1 Tax=Dactylosporangium aurantiacum TaxID=35754 RepID=A0A9Q9MLZ3_9ACTN|nr:site-specific integrase [Dactylosporangium aurantiacum]MDG6109636.1 site-specific integrase [Dactylosporangium aurantiacum]UWZ54252.1 site-specific integrase [Dactylosporangium aurantiacum]
MADNKRRRFGAVRQLPSGQWQARFTGPDGQMHAAPQTYSTKALAERYLSTAEGDIASGRWISPLAAKMPISEWANQWFTASQSRWKIKTQETYRSVIDRLIVPHLGKVKLGAIRPLAVTRWVGTLAETVSASQVRQAYRLLSQIMASAVDNGMIPVTPCRGGRVAGLPRLPQAKPTVLAPADVARLSAKCELPDRVLVLLLAYAGLRIGEALPLRRRSFDLSSRRLIVAEAVSQVRGGSVIGTPKNHQQRELVLPTFVADAVAELLGNLPEGEDAFLFGGRQKHTSDRQQSYYGFRSRFRVAAEAAGLDGLKPHDLRATHASWVSDSHGIIVAAARLGHADASVTTRHYARPLGGKDEEVAAHLDKVARKASGTRMARKIKKNVP